MAPSQLAENELSELASPIGYKFHFKHKRALLAGGRGGVVEEEYNAFWYEAFKFKRQFLNKSPKLIYKLSKFSTV